MHYFPHDTVRLLRYGRWMKQRNVSIGWIALYRWTTHIWILCETRAQLWTVITQPSTQGKKRPLCSLNAHGVTCFVLLNNAVFYWNIICYGLFKSTPWTGYKSWSIRSVIVSHLVGLAQTSRDNRRGTCGPAGVGLWMKGTSLQELDWKNVGLQKQVRESTVQLLIPTNLTALMIGKNKFKRHK